MLPSRWLDVRAKLLSVYESLVQLLDHPIDYAGIFPPANLTITEALNEYLRLLESDEAWLVDRFIVDVPNLPALARALGDKGYAQADDHALIATVIGTPITELSGAKTSIQDDLKVMQDHDLVPITAYELKIEGNRAEAIAKILSKLDLEAMDMDIYLELPWGEDMDEQMSDIASVNEALRFKARMGGVKRDAFPGTSQVAGFIAACSGLDMGFKFTAGLHQPLRYLDAEMNVHHHGFLNVMVAAALAIGQDLSRTEIEEILVIQDGSLFKLTEGEIRVHQHVLSLDDISLFWNYFGGFGSCNVEEPVEGLMELGYLQP